MKGVIDDEKLELILAAILARGQKDKSVQMVLRANYPNPSLIIATQNPIEMAGTFPLPEAQLDRFLIMLDLGYPEYIDEITIFEREEHSNPLDALSALISMDDIIALQEQAKQVDVMRHLKVCYRSVRILLTLQKVKIER